MGDARLERRRIGKSAANSPSVCTKVSSCQRYPVERWFVSLASPRFGRITREKLNGRGLRTSPKINMRISFFDHTRPDSHDMLAPILKEVCWFLTGTRCGMRCGRCVNSELSEGCKRPCAGSGVEMRLVFCHNIRGWPRDRRVAEV